MSFRITICVGIFVLLGRLLWSIALAALGSYLIYEWPDHPWRILAGLLFGACFPLLGSFLAKERVLATFVSCIAQSTAVAGVLLIGVIAKVWMAKGWVEMDPTEVAWMIALSAMLASYLWYSRKWATKRGKNARGRGFVSQ